ncbi:hypothetical protein BT63DRAFT_459287 [Microthyrium microscopicum]|uniref:Uncharacterized protein n=1 Tax=Microthyrium microscopicum TaxID=703497 RepID=A0A6A6U1C3_9PEZI|nr:hypothetical protein BT63DRAFT_459287 [Microthyrium microscopicum]
MPSINITLSGSHHANTTSNTIDPVNGECKPSHSLIALIIWAAFTAGFAMAFFGTRYYYKLQPKVDAYRRDKAIKEQNERVIATTRAPPVPVEIELKSVKHGKRAKRRMSKQSTLLGSVAGDSDEDIGLVEDDGGYKGRGKNVVADELR